MKLGADQILDYPLVLIVMIVCGLWLASEGEEMTNVIAIVAFSTVVMVVGLTIGLIRIEPAKRAQQLRKARQGFPWGKFASGNAVLGGVMSLVALHGLFRPTWGLDAVLLVVGNAAFVAQWLLQRRLARLAGYGARNSAGQQAGGAGVVR